MEVKQKLIIMKYEDDTWNVEFHGVKRLSEVKFLSERAVREAVRLLNRGIPLEETSVLNLVPPTETGATFSLDEGKKESL